jgi:putative membrane protein
MPSERRLHPFSILFAFLAQLRAFVLPGILVLVGASTRGSDWQPWMMLFVVPTAIVAMLRYVSFRYRYDPHQMVIRSGLVFRKERHIPYARIQNVDAVQNVLHRMLNVVEVRIETAGGQTPEATMSVLPVAAFEEMRRRVFAERQQAEIVEAAPAEPSATELLRLTTRELLLCGFLENRGGVLIAAGFGIVWEFGVMDGIMERIFGSEAAGRRVVRDLIRDATSNVDIAIERIGITLAALLFVLVFIRMMSMAWALVRLYGFRLTLANEDLRSEYGLLTHVAATIPLRRLQTLTIQEGPLHRLFHRVAVRADTAGGRPHEGRRSERELLAPILRVEALPWLVAQVLPSVNYDAVRWQPVSPRAFRREVKGWLVMAGLVSAGLSWLLAWWALLVIPLVIGWAIICAKKTVKHLGWALADDAVFYRTGWLWRRVSIVRFAKIQTVTLAATPFDRRHAMARVRVDAAGSTESSRVNIPYLPQDLGGELQRRLAHETASREFTW